MKVSVITPLYNSSAFIRGTLDSLINQTYTNWESILVDDGSTDDTARVIEPYLKDKRFRCISQENRGIAGARNTGIRAASAEWICLLDHDDRWLPEKLEQQVRYALEHGHDIICTDAFIVTERARWLYGGGFPETAAAVERSLTDPSEDVFAHLIKLNFACTSSVMVRRTLFDQHGLLDPSVVPSDDYDMWLRCMPEARFGYLTEPLVEYSMHGGNYSKNMERLLESIIRVQRRHRRRHAADVRRRRQFDAALAYYFDLLFQELWKERSRGHALWRALSLVTRAPWCLGPLLRLAAGAAWVRLSARAKKIKTRAKKSATYRLRLLRAWKPGP